MKEKKEAPRGLVLAAVFLMMIFCLPLATLCRNLTSDKKADSAEQEEEPQKDWFLTMRSAVDDFTDSLVLRRNLISLNAELTILASGGTYIQSTQVLLGKNNWLFYKSTADGNPLWDYRGTHPYTEDELAGAAANLTAFRDLLTRSGVRFLAVIYPNKENLYSEHMPDTILRVADNSRADALADYIRANTDVVLLYPKEELLNAKDNGSALYYRTDTHWNTIGAFVGMQSVFRELYGTDIPFDADLFPVDRTDYSGDLAKISGLESRFAYDTKYSYQADVGGSALYHDEVLLLIGDSFSEALSDVMSPHYRAVHYVRTTDFTMDMLAEYRPDIVVWECVERRVDRFFTHDLTQQ